MRAPTVRFYSRGVCPLARSRNVPGEMRNGHGCQARPRCFIYLCSDGNSGLSWVSRIWIFFGNRTYAAAYQSCFFLSGVGGMGGISYTRLYRTNRVG